MPIRCWLKAIFPPEKPKCWTSTLAWDWPWWCVSGRWIIPGLRAAYRHCRNSWLPRCASKFVRITLWHGFYFLTICSYYTVSIYMQLSTLLRNNEIECVTVLNLGWSKPCTPINPVCNWHCPKVWVALKGPRIFQARTVTYMEQPTILLS